LSKIHKALERAHREREGDVTREVLPLVLEEVEKENINPTGKVMGPRPRGPLLTQKVISGQRLVTFYDPDSVASEQFRKLRTQLLRLRLPHPPKTILVTSARAGEGKTLVSANLAAGIAHDFNAYALLVDSDLRSPSLGSWFGISNGYGLSDYLVGKREIPELLFKTEIERLRILLGGTLQENPTELIGSARMESLVQELRSRYSDRYIIFDSTPLLATSEPEILSKMVDGILVVVRAGETARETVKQAIASLPKEKILGMVLNDIQFKSSGLTNRYFGSKDSYYGYRYGQKRKGSDNGK
jgi:exopolysaccharide/PEP-CTERM locus tyrosine autokinase